MDITLNYPRPHRIRFNCDLCSLSSFCLLSVKMSKCKFILDFFKFNSESEILKRPDHSEPSVSGLPVTCVSYESESMDDDDTDSDLEAV